MHLAQPLPSNEEGIAVVALPLLFVKKKNLSNQSVGVYFMVLYNFLSILL
jgi:hypothetical protein